MMSSYTCDIIITINVTWYMLLGRIGPLQNIAHVCIHDIIWLAVMFHIVNSYDIMAVLVAGKAQAVCVFVHCSNPLTIQHYNLRFYLCILGKTQNGLLNKCASILS